MVNNKNLQQLFEEFIKECRFSSGLRPETIRGYSDVFRHFLAIMPEVTNTGSLTTEMITEFFKRLQTRQRIVGRATIKIGVRKSTIKTYWSKLNSFFEWLVQNKSLEENPLKKIKPPQQVYEDLQALEDRDIHKILAAITLHSANSLTLRRDMAMVSLLVFCGLRLGEFISLEIWDIDLDKQLLTVRGETSKSKKTRYIPMHPTLVLHIREYLKERNKKGYKTEFLLVSSKRDERLGRHGLKHWVKRLNVSSGVKFHLHKFRHTFACNLAKKDVNVFKIQKFLGHTSSNGTEQFHPRALACGSF